MTAKFKKDNFGLVIIGYIVLGLALQILDLDNKGSLMDTAWKILVFSMLMTYGLVYLLTNKKGPMKGIVISLIFLFIQVVTGYLNLDLVVDPFSSFVELMLPFLQIFLFLYIFGGKKVSIFELKRLLIGFVFFMVFSTLYNFYHNIDVIMSFFDIKDAYQISLSSFFHNRNTFAWFLIFGVFSCLALINIEVNKSKLYKCILIFFMLNLIMTLSRSGLFVVVIFFIIYYFQNNKINLAKVSKILLFLILLLILAPSIFTFINDMFVVRSNVGFAGRDIIYKVGFKMFLNKPILGGGLIVPVQRLFKQTGNFFFHNTYINILTRGGIVLFAFHFYLIFIGFKNSYIIKKNDKLLGSLFTSLLISYLFYSFTESRVLFDQDMASFVTTLFTVLLPTYIANFITNVE